MNKVTKKELVEKANDHELRIFQIEKALEQHGINWFVEEPKLKQLDQSIFNGLDKKWRFAMVSSVGIPFVYDYKPTGKRHFISDKNAQLMINLGKVMRIDEYDYDTTDWQNSLIERKELTGSDLARAMLERGDSSILVRLGLRADDVNGSGRLAIVTKMTGSSFVIITDQPLHNCQYVVPINNQGEPLTQSEAGL